MAGVTETGGPSRPRGAVAASKQYRSSATLGFTDCASDQSRLIQSVRIVRCIAVVSSLESHVPSAGYAPHTKEQGLWCVGRNSQPIWTHALYVLVQDYSRDSILLVSMAVFRPPTIFSITQLR